MSSIRPSPPTLQIDGDKIKRLREEHGVTQVYIAEVTGVSVDTVSRWENNRSPGVKRENAEALAAALEVEVSDILRDDVVCADAPEDEFDSPQPRKNKTLLAAIFAAVALIVSAAVWKLSSPLPLEIEPTRKLPAYTPPGTEIPVVIEVNVVSGKGRRIVLRETIPQGWKFIGSVAAPDQGPTNSGLIKWILDLDSGTRKIAYLVKSPSKAKEGTSFQFTGDVVVGGKDGAEVKIKGESRIDIEFVHWADIDADFQISDSEVLEALERLDAARGLELDPSAPRDLWGTDGYYWDDVEKTFKPN